MLKRREPKHLINYAQIETHTPGGDVAQSLVGGSYLLHWPPRACVFGPLEPLCFGLFVEKKAK